MALRLALSFASVWLAFAAVPGHVRAGCGDYVVIGGGPMEMEHSPRDTSRADKETGQPPAPCAHGKCERQPQRPVPTTPPRSSSGATDRDAGLPEGIQLPPILSFTHIEVENAKLLEGVRPRVDRPPRR